MSSVKWRLEVTALNYWTYTYIRMQRDYHPKICSTIRAVLHLSSTEVDPLFSGGGVSISLWSLACNPALNCLSVHPISFCRNKWNLKFWNKTTQIPYDYAGASWTYTDNYISLSFLKPQKWTGLEKRWKWTLMFDNPKSFSCFSNFVILILIELITVKPKSFELLRICLPITVYSNLRRESLVFL